MLHDPSFLNLAHELLKEKFVWKIFPGLRIARGFADVGYEEYSVLSERMMISLSTGQKGDIPDSYSDHFFPVYTSDEISSVLYEKGVDIEQIVYIDQRTWKGSFSKDDVRKIVEAQKLEEMFLRALLSVIRGEFDV